MWQCLVQGLLVFGNDPSNAWPWYVLTEHGRKVIQQGAPQPYDPDGQKREKYQMDLTTNWTIASRYKVLSERLEGIVTAKKVNVPRGVADTIAGALPGGYDILRRTRNAAGHPEIPVGVDADTVFLNLRMFIEYARRLYELIGFLQGTRVDW